MNKISINNDLKAFIFYIISSGINIFLSIFLIKLSFDHLLTLQESIFIKVFFPFWIIIFIKFSQIKKDIKLVTLKQIKYLILLSFFSLIDVFSWIKALETIPVNNAMIITFISPVLTLIFNSAINKEKINLKKKISILTSCLSAIFCINFIVQKFNIGYFYLFLDIVSATFIIMLLKKFKSFSVYFIMLTRIVLIIPFSLIFNKFFIDSPNISFNIIFNTLTVENGNILNIIFDSKNLIYVIIPIAYLIERLSFIKMYQYGSIAFIQPLRYLNIVFSSFFGYLLLNQKLTNNQIVCFVVIILSNIINIINFKKFFYFICQKR